MPAAPLAPERLHPGSRPTRWKPAPAVSWRNRACWATVPTGVLFSKRTTIDVTLSPLEATSTCGNDSSAYNRRIVLPCLRSSLGAPHAFSTSPTLLVPGVTPRKLVVSNSTGPVCTGSGMGESFSSLFWSVAGLSPLAGFAAAFSAAGSVAGLLSPAGCKSDWGSTGFRPAFLSDRFGAQRRHSLVAVRCLPHPAPSACLGGRPHRGVYQLHTGRVLRRLVSGRRLLRTGLLPGKHGKQCQRQNNPRTSNGLDLHRTSLLERRQIGRKWAKMGLFRPLVYPCQLSQVHSGFSVAEEFL